MSVTLCPQCQEPVSVASGSGRNYCNLCGWVDTYSDGMSAAERILKKKRDSNEQAQSTASARVRFFYEGLHTLSLMGSRFPILNVLILIFYGLACLFVLASGIALFSDSGTGPVRFAAFLFFLFIAAANMGFAEVLKLFLAMESHLHIVRLSVAQHVIVDDSR